MAVELYISPYETAHGIVVLVKYATSERSTVSPEPLVAVGIPKVYDNIDKEINQNSDQQRHQGATFLARLTR